MHRLTFTMEGKTLVVAREGDPASLRIDLLSLEPNTRHTMDFEILPEENRQLFMLEHLPDDFYEKEDEDEDVLEAEFALKTEDELKREEYQKYYGLDDPHRMDEMLAVFSHHRKLFLMYGRRYRIYHSLVRFNAVVRHMSLTERTLGVDAFVYAENNYGLKVEGAYFGIDVLSDLKTYDIPVCESGLSRWGKYKPKYFRHFTFPLDQFADLLKIGGTKFSVWLKVEGIYIKYSITKKFRNTAKKQHENKEYYVPLKSTYSRDYAVQIRRTYYGHLTLVKRPMEEIEHTAGFRFKESRPVTAVLFYSGKLFGKLRRKKIALFYEKLAAKAEEGTYELFERCDQDGKAKCYYIIDKNSPDYARIGGKHHVVAKFSWKYYYLIFNVDCFVSTEAPIHLSLMDDNSRLVRWNLCKHPFIFLQHGITYLKPQGTRSTFSVGKAGEPAYIVVSSEKEGAAVNRMMGTPLERNLITGMMMFDYCPYKHINRDTEDRIVIMMTWRPYENFIEKFEDSTYYQYTMQVYDILKQYVDEDKIIIVPHPKVLEGLKSAVGEDKIWTKPISEVLGLAKLLITDYSSVGYNSFYQGGGVVFYQPDLERFEEYMQMPLVPQPEEYIGYRALDEENLHNVLAPGFTEGKIDLDYFRTQEYERRYLEINKFHDGKNTERIYQFLTEKIFISRKERQKHDQF